MSSFKVCKAKTLSSGSVSDRKPRTPEAEVKPGMVDALIEDNGGTLWVDLLWKLEDVRIRGLGNDDEMGWLC